MNDNEPMDLSSLRADADPEQWNGFTERTLERLELTLARRRSSPVRTLVDWSRPLAIAAALLFAALIPVEWFLETREPHAEEIQTLVRLSTSTLITGADPTGAQLVEALGRGTSP